MVFREGNCQGNQNYEPIQLNTLLERFYAEVKNKHGKTSQTTILFHRKGFWHRLDNSLNWLGGLLTFLRLIDVTISLYIIILIVRGWFDRMHRFESIIFALDVRALLLRNYDKLSRVFSCILLIHNHMIFLVQFGINKHLLIFSKTTNCTRPLSWINSFANVYL